MSEAFDNHALAALLAHAGAWLNPADDLARLRLLARRLRFSREHELTRAGRCDRCGGGIKDDVLVREEASGSAPGRSA
jgi:hypothetical protein